MENQLRTVRADITKIVADAIVSAEWEWLTGKHGVSAAIHRAAGKRLWEEIERRNISLAEGEAVSTYSYGMMIRAYRIIHTVGPHWIGGWAGEFKTLYRCYVSCLDEAKMCGCRSIAFPCISTGARGFPSSFACSVAVNAVRKWLAENNSDMKVTFVTFTDEDERVYNEKLEKLKAKA